MGKKRQGPRDEGRDVGACGVTVGEERAKAEGGKKGKVEGRKRAWGEG